MAYSYIVEMEGLIAGGFTEVTGLESEIELESYQEGGENGYTHQFRRPTRYPNLVLSHGLTDSDTLWRWYKAAITGNLQLKNGAIVLLNQQRQEKMRWNFKNAYPVKWIGSQFNASNATAVAVEKLELVHQGVDRIDP